MATIRPSVMVNPKALQEAGATVRQDAQDVGGGKLISTVADVDGNVTGLVQNP